MRILELKCSPVGPLTKPVFFQSVKNCVVVFDENEAGKTSLVDIIVNMLFRRGSAQSRFQSRRYSDYKGYVKLEHQGEIITCKGSIDLDKLLGLPAEFSRLPIVRGSDLYFLWSSNREKKGPLIEACIQHFTADCENNLGAVAANVRSAAGLPAKRNGWTKSKTDELREYLDLYRKKDFLLTVMASREETKRELQGVGERLQTVKKKLSAAEEEKKALEGEYQAALCDSAGVWERKLSALRIEYQESGYERYSREDLQLWAESAAKEQSVKERENTLKTQISDTEIKILGLRQQQDKVSRCLKEAEETCAAARDTLTSIRYKREEMSKEHSKLRAEMHTLLHSIRSAVNQKKSIKWALAAGPVLAIVGLLTIGLFFLGAIFLIAGLVIFGWALTVSRSCGRTIKETEEKMLQLARTVGIHPAGTPDEMVSFLEGYLEKQDEEIKEALVKAEKEYQEQEEKLNNFIQENSLCEREIERLAQDLREFHNSLTECAGELDRVQGTVERLMQKTGKPDPASLEKAVKQKECMERDIDLAVTRLKTLLGSEDEWREKLLALKPYMEQYPNPRSVEELDEEKTRLETALQELREQEDLLQQQFDKLRQQELEESKSLYAAGCGDAATLALRLKEAEQVLESAIRESLAALWVQKAAEAAKEDFEVTLLEPLSRASEIFHSITGRYDAINYVRQGGELSFTVSQQGTTYSEELLSDGAKAQLLLSLRLALLEQILGGEAGFLVLDDPLLNSSQTRKQKAVEVLLDYARRGWQLLYFTVDGVAAEIFQELGGDLVEFKRVRDFYS